MTIDFAAIATRCRPVLQTVWFRRLLSVLIYVSLALATTWPLIQSPLTSLPKASTRVLTVPLFNLWTIWWNADRAAAGFAGYWDAPIFHPTHDTFAFSETQLTTVVVAPIIWTTGSRVLAYNVYLWLALVLNGVFAESLLRTLKVRSWAALAGGCAMVLLPLVHWQLDVIQLAPIWSILWCWSACWRMTRMPTTERWPTVIARGCEVGASVSITFHACGHHGLFLGLLMVATGWLLPRRWLDRRLWAAVVVSGVVVLVTVGPFAWHMTQVMQHHNFKRDESLITSLSAMPQDFLSAYGVQLLGFGAKWARPHWSLSQGLLKLGLAVLGAVLGLWRRRTRRFTLFLVAMITVSFLLSLGTNLRVGDWQLWPVLLKYVPGIGQVRNVFRFAYFTQIAIVILATQAVWWLWLRLHARLVVPRKTEVPATVAEWLSSATPTALPQQAGSPPDEAAAIAVMRDDQLAMPVSESTAAWLRQRTLRPEPAKRSVRIACRVAGAVLAAVAAFEVLPFRVELGQTPDEKENANWINFVKEQTPKGSAIVCLSFPKGYQVEDFESATRWMYFGTFHKVPLTNGYSGFFPLDYFSTQEALNAPSNYGGILSRLENEGVYFVVTRREPAGPEPARSATFGLMRMELVFDDPCGVLVYRLRRLPPPPMN